MTEKEFAYLKLGTYDAAYALLTIFGFLLLVFGVLVAPFSIEFAWGLGVSAFFMFVAALIASAYYLKTELEIKKLTNKGN